MDKNRNLFLERDELVSWLVRMEEGYRHRDLNEQFGKSDMDGDDSITFDEIVKSFGLEGSAFVFFVFFFRSESIVLTVSHKSPGPEILLISGRVV